MYTFNINKENIMEIPKCNRCKRKVNLRLDKGSICYECSDKHKTLVRSHNEGFKTKFEEFMRIYATKRIHCLCGKVSTMKEGHDKLWIKIPNGPFMCEVCKNNFRFV